MDLFKSEKNKIFLSLSFILIAAFLAFFPSLNSGFVDWDDGEMVFSNPKITTLSFENIKKMFTESHYGLYHPMVHLSYAVENQLFGMYPEVFHRTNLLMHLANSVLVFFFFYLLSRKIMVAFIAGLLFGIHPIQVESVAWISERKDMLYAMFYLSALIAYLFYIDTEKTKFYFLAFLLFVFSLLSKAMAISLPLALVLCDYYRRRNILKGKLPFFLMSLVFGAIAVVAKRSSGALVVPEPPFSIDNIYINSYRILFYYLPRIFMQFNFRRLYPDDSYISVVFAKMPFIFVVSPLILLVFLGIVIYAFRRNRKIIFGIGYFLFSILPAILFVQVGCFADRYVYLPVIGIFYLLGEGVDWLYQKKAFKKSILAVILFISLITATLTWQRCLIWRDSLTLNSEVCKWYPNIFAPYLQRADIYVELGDYDEALENFGIALEKDPENPDILVNRGNLFLKMGKHALAIADFNRAIGVDPDHKMAHNNLGIVYVAKRQYAEALIEFNKALQVDPENAMAYSNRGNLYLRLGKYNKAIMDLNQAIKYEPEGAKFYFSRSEAYYEDKKYAKALSDVRKAQALGFKVDPLIIETLEQKLQEE